MATFTLYNDRLPDPTFGVNDTGVESASGTYGPGFANATIRSVRPSQVSRTNSGKGVHRETGSHNWEININYHPMLRDHFDVVSSFLDARNGRMKPFYVVLPQYSKPKNATFAIYAAANILKVQGAHAAGSSTLLIQAPGTLNAYPRPNDYFTITDPNDINHQKTYKITRVETNALYELGKIQPAVNEVRVHIMPPLTKFTASQAIINFINPKFRVIQKSDVIETQLNTDNLYSFQLDLEEIQP
jgi:hypothetical protein